MKKGTGIIIITAVFALLLCAGCAGQEDSAIEVTVTALCDSRSKAARA